MGNDTRNGLWEGVGPSTFSRQQWPRTRSALLAIIAVMAGPTSLRAGVSITEYPIPMASSTYPVDITPGPDGALWFTENESNNIGRITTAGVFTEYPSSTPGNNVDGITAGPDGALWFTEQSGGIGRITTTGVITHYGQTTLSEPVGITTGPDGALWFTEPYRNKIGRITTAGVVTEYLVPTADSEPYGVAAGPDGALWFTEVYGNKIGRITTKGVFTEYPIPTAGSEAYEITAGPDGALWFTEFWGNQVGRITTAGAITEYPDPMAGGPDGITAGPDGALWFTESYGDSIGRITTEGVITEYPSPALLGSLGITTGPDGALWFTDEEGQIGRLGLPPYVCTNTEPPVITSINSASSFGGYPYFASGSWLEIKGTNLADLTDPRLWATANPGQWTAADFNGPNAPTVLDGISASVNGKPAYVWYLSPGQVNVQAPEDSFIGSVPSQSPTATPPVHSSTSRASRLRRVCLHPRASTSAALNTWRPRSSRTEPMC